MKHRTLALTRRQPPLLCKGGQAELRTMQTSQTGAVATNDDVIATLLLHRAGAVVAVRARMCMSSCCKIQCYASWIFLAMASYPLHVCLHQTMCGFLCQAIRMWDSL